MWIGSIISSIIPPHRYYLNAYAYFDNIYVAGVSGDVCCKHAIDGLIEHKGKEFDFGTLYIVKDCIASLDTDDFDAYLTSLVLEYDFVKVINSKNL